MAPVTAGDGSKVRFSTWLWEKPAAHGAGSPKSYARAYLLVRQMRLAKNPAEVGPNRSKFRPWTYSMTE
jgi:hypothetical protein